MYIRTPLRRILRSLPGSFTCTRRVTTNSPSYDTASARIQHLSELKSTYEIVKSLKDVYSTIDSTFIQDIAATYKEEKLPLNVLRNEKLKEYILKDCCELVLKDDANLIKNSFKILQRTGILPRYESQGVDAASLRMEFLQFMMNENRISLATICILSFTDHDINVPYSTTKLFIDVISSSPFRDFSTNAYCLLQVLRITTRIDPTELFTSLMYLSSNVNGNYFANHLFFKCIEDGLFFEMSFAQQHSVILSMLEVNLENNDALMATKIWRIANPIVLRSTPSRSQVLSYVEKLTTAFQLYHDKNIIEKELDQLPACLDTEFMIDYKLSFYSQHSRDKFDALVNILRSPLRRSSLTALLKSFIHLRDEANAEKIMETIFAHSSINCEELYTIVEKLLQQNKITEATSMIRRMSLETTKRSYLSVFKHTWKNKDQVFFKELYLKFMQLDCDDQVLEAFTIELIKAISSINNRQAIRYYTKFLKKVDFQPYKTNEFYQQIDFRRYGFLDEFAQLIRLTPFGMVECLKVMSKHAVNDGDDVSLRWCIEEFRKSGWRVDTIMDYLEYFDGNGYLRKTLKPRAFE